MDGKKERKKDQNDRIEYYEKMKYKVYEIYSTSLFVESWEASDIVKIFPSFSSFELLPLRAFLLLLPLRFWANWNRFTNVSHAKGL